MHPGNLPITADKLDPAVLEQQRGRMAGRCHVNSFFLGKVYKELAECDAISDVPHLVSQFAKLLRFCIDRRGVARFPVWKVAGNAVAFGMKKNKISKPNDVDKLCARYVERDDTNLEEVRDHFATLHIHAMALEEDSFTKRGEDPPYVPRYEHLAGMPEPQSGSGLMQQKDVANAREVDLFRSIAYVQSHILRRIRTIYTQAHAGGDVAQIFDMTRQWRARLRHISYIDARHGIYPTASMPMLAGCAYFEARQPGGIRPAIGEFLDQKGIIEDIGAYVTSLTPAVRLTLFREVERGHENWPGGIDFRPELPLPLVGQPPQAIHEAILTPGGK